MNKWYKYVIPLVIGVVALGIPLVRDFHFESAMLASVTGAYWNAWLAAGRKENNPDLVRSLEISSLLYIAGLPLLIYALITGCYTVHGLGFWIFLPLPSVFLGGGIGRLIRHFNIPYPRTMAVVILLVLTFGGWVYEFLSFPQLYFYNHIWGYWPGPIYDEAVQFPLSIIAFRFLTFCWILIIWLIPNMHQDSLYRWLTGLAALGLVVGYTQLEQLRIITPERFLQQQLGGRIESPDARIHYEDQAFSDQEIGQLKTEIEFYIYQVKQALQIEKPDSTDKIEVYLYADPWQKKELVGAKYTSYVTVWQQTPQIHIAKEQVGGSLKHEVVHAVTALLDWPGLVPNIGLTEGIAVALDPDRSPQSTIDQLVAASQPYPTAVEMESSLSYWGFYTGRSAVSYTTTGSFVRYLIENYPPREFVEAYRCGNLQQGYTETIDHLVAGWHQRLDSVRVDSSDLKRAREIFGRLSIFEQRCPHKVPRAAELFDRFMLSETRADTTEILAVLEEFKELKSGEHSPRFLWMLWNLKAGNIKPVIKESDLGIERIEIQLLSADAYELENRQSRAQKHLLRAVELADQQADSTFDEAVATRMDTFQWHKDMQLRYQNVLLDTTDFEKVYYRLKIRALQNLMDRGEIQAGLLESYSRHLLDIPLDLDYYDIYLKIIHQLAYEQKFLLARRWIERLEEEDLSLRYRERLRQQEDWLQYVKMEDVITVNAAHK